MLLFLLFSSFSFANEKDDEAKLKKEFGPDLTRAPFYLQFTFNQKYNKDWSKSYYTERKEFLIAYEATALEEQAKEKSDAKAAADAEKERIRDKKEADREAREKKRAEQAAERAEKAAERQRQKEFDDELKLQQKELKEMHQQSTQGTPPGT